MPSQISQPSTNVESFYPKSTSSAVISTATVSRLSTPVTMSYSLNVTSNGSIPLSTVTLPTGHLVTSNIASFPTTSTKSSSPTTYSSFTPPGFGISSAHAIYSTVTSATLPPAPSDYSSTVYGSTYHRKSPPEIEKYKMKVNGPSEEPSSQDSAHLIPQRDVNENHGRTTSV